MEEQQVEPPIPPSTALTSELSKNSDAHPPETSSEQSRIPATAPPPIMISQGPARPPTAVSSVAISTPTPIAAVNERPLNVSDALGYLDEVKNRFHDRPDVYNKFLDIMKDFKSQALTTPGVIERVSTLFSGHPVLISGFNTFLPPGYRIECSTGENQRITVTTPNGTLTQNAAGSLTDLQSRTVPPAVLPIDPPRDRDAEGDIRIPENEPRMKVEAPIRESLPSMAIPSNPSTPLPSRSHAPTPQPQLPIPQAQVAPQTQLPLPPPPALVQTTPQSILPIPAAHPGNIALPPPNPTIAAVVMPAMSNPLVLTPAVALNSTSTTASAASVLGGMHRVTSNPEPAPQPAHPPASFHPSLPQAQPPPPSNPVPLATPAHLPGPGLQAQPQTQPEFYHAIQYINRIKTRFSDEPETYKQFLEILQTYQKEQRPLQDVYAQVTQLFRNAPDLIDEFKLFLPDTNANAGITPGLIPPANYIGAPIVGPGGTVGVMGMLGQSGTPGPTPGQATCTPQGTGTEWTMEVQAVNTKGDKTSGYRRKVAGSDQNREGPPVKKRRKANDKESRTDKEKERDRERENQPATQNAKVASRTKKPRHAPRGPEPASPTFSQYPQPPSPANGSHIPFHPAMHSHPSLPPMSQGMHHQPQPSRPLSPPPVPAAPELFFDRVKRALDDRDVWEEFLKLLSLYSTDIIDERLLMQMAAPFLGGQGSELGSQFRDILGVDRTRKNNIGETPKNAGHAHGYGQPSGIGASFLVGPQYRFGPSYRRLPDSESNLACSGRDELCRSVLNDGWVSHPTWASEDSGFIAHKKNIYEEALHKSEEERHEYHVHLESMAHTISLLEPIAFKLEDMPAEERATFRLTPGFGGRSKSIHQKIIKKVYGRENAHEVLQGLQDNPSVAVPVVLDRLKQVNAEWRKNKREWEKVWREVDSRNFYKSLDHQGIGFKTNDKKAITGKALLAEIERIKLEQDTERAKQEKAARSSNPHERTKWSQVLPRHQLEYDMRDESVLQDAIKLTLCFLERNDQRQSGSNVPQYNAVERRRIEAFLRHYVVYQFGVGPDFDAAFGPPIEQAEWEDLGLYVPDGDEDTAEEEEQPRKGRKSGRRSGGGGSGGAVPAGDLKKKLNKTKKAMEKSHGRKTQNTSKANSGSSSSYHRSLSSSRQGSPAPPASDPVSPPREEQAGITRSSKEKGKGREADANDIWLRHVDLDIPGQLQNSVGDTASANTKSNGQGSKVKQFGSFFCNTTFYTLIRLLELLYSRLMECKDLAAKLARDSPESFLPNPVALNLGLTDTAGPVAYFADLASGTCSVNNRRPIRVAAALMSHPSAQDNTNLNPAKHFYVHMLDLVEKVFDGELDQTTFEENLRFMFGTRAFIVFTLDKLCAAICKQVQAVIQDGRCHELMSMLEHQRARDAESHASSIDVAIQDVVRYRRQAEALVGSDENLFRVDWLVDKRLLRIQLLDADDLSIDPPATQPQLGNDLITEAEAVKFRMWAKWKQYVQSYVLRYPTEGRRMGFGRKIFLKKTLMEEDADELVDTQWKIDDKTFGNGLQVMVGPGTCKLYYASGCEETVWRLRERKPREGNNGKRKVGRPDDVQDGEEEDEIGEWERLKERAEARGRERRRWMAQFEQGLLFLD